MASERPNNSLVSSAAKENNGKLPQTGASRLGNVTTILGFALAILGSVFGLVDTKKRKKD